MFFFFFTFKIIYGWNECSTCEYLKHDNSYFKRIDIQFLMEILSMQREVQIVVSIPIRLILIWNKIYSTLLYAYLLIISIQIQYANILCHCESNYIKQFFLVVSFRNQRIQKQKAF